MSRLPVSGVVPIIPCELTGPIVDGGLYLDGWGNERHVIASALPHGRVDHAIVWTIEGWWYRRSDGRRMSFTRPGSRPSPYDLVRYVGTHDYPKKPDEKGTPHEDTPHPR